MKNYILIATFFLFVCKMAVAQDSVRYVIEGHYKNISADSLVDTLYIGQVSYSADGDKSRIPVVPDSNGIFKLTGSISYPRLFILYTPANESNKVFFLDSVPVSLFFPSNNLKEVVIRGSDQHFVFEKYKQDEGQFEAIRRELYNNYGALFGNPPKAKYSEEDMKELSAKVGSSFPSEKKELIASHNRLLNEHRRFFFLKYLRDFPGTYAISEAWIHFYSSFADKNDLMEYKQEMLEGIARFPENFKRNPVVDEYIRAVNSIGRHNLGDIFPEVKLRDSTDTEWSVDGLLLKNDYVLVDFWASWCGPCITNLNQINSSLSTSDIVEGRLQIMTISIDKERDKWLNSVRSLKYPWVQVWAPRMDPYMSSFFIPVIPLNYLLDKDRRIVKINITPEEVVAIMEGRPIEVD